MTPQEFINLWKGHDFNEREGAQLHFSHLCRLLGVDEPLKKGEYQFERGAEKSSGGNGWADVWKRGHFAWENKKPGRDLKAALKQLTDHALQLESPPLLVVCDREHITIHKAFTGYPDEPETILIEDLGDESVRQRLRWIWTDPNKLRPEKSSAAITAEAAKRFADLAEAMRQRGEDRDKVAHFLVQCLFCMFAEDEELLPKGIFTNLLTNAGADVAKATGRIEKLFKAMGEPKGEYGDHDIAWFNGGLFKDIAAPTLTASDLETLRSAAADMDWRAIDPTIFGTLFERGLGEQRAPLGAHYTDTGTIAKLVDPLVREPLLAEWAATRAQIAELAPKFGMVKSRGKSYRANDALQKGESLYRGFLLRLNQFRVLDPACGSGNFLYLALKALRDVEKLAHVQAQELGLHGEVTMQTGPHNILGLEINEFAAELARVTVWIGDIQWCRKNGWQHSVNPILKPLDGIENRDALLNEDGSEAEWPKADVIVGNPPRFHEDKLNQVWGRSIRSCPRRSQRTHRSDVRDDGKAECRTKNPQRLRRAGTYRTCVSSGRVAGGGIQALAACFAASLACIPSRFPWGVIGDCRGPIQRP
ncbi:DNA methyltransferase [Pseudoxanthomonas mexicana]